MNSIVKDPLWVVSLVSKSLNGSSYLSLRSRRYLQHRLVASGRTKTHHQTTSPRAPRYPASNKSPLHTDSTASDSEKCCAYSVSLQISIHHSILFVLEVSLPNLLLMFAFVVIPIYLYEYPALFVECTKLENLWILFVTLFVFVSIVCFLFGKMRKWSWNFYLLL